MKKQKKVQSQNKQPSAQKETSSGSFCENSAGGKKIHIIIIIKSDAFAKSQMKGNANAKPVPLPVLTGHEAISCGAIFFSVLICHQTQINKLPPVCFYNHHSLYFLFARYHSECQNTPEKRIKLLKTLPWSLTLFPVITQPGTKENLCTQTRWLQRYECSGEHSALAPVSGWERKPFTVVFVKRKRSDSSTWMGKTALFIISCSGQHVLWEKKRYSIHFLAVFLCLLWVGSSTLALIEVCARSAVVKWRSQPDD